MENITLLNHNELSVISGGTFAWDAGWLLGNAIAGAGVNPAQTAEALIDYWIHYNL